MIKLNSSSIFKKVKTLINFILVLSLMLFYYPKNAQALYFDIIAPDETFNQGDEVTFTILINTEGAAINSARTGVEYDTVSLEFVNAIPGDTFSSISVEDLGGGRFILTGSSDTPYSGSGVFAYVTFRIIATEPGSTELCVLFDPDAEPTVTPSTTPITQPPSGTPITQPPSGTPITQPPSGTPTLPQSGNPFINSQIVLTAVFLLIFSFITPIIQKTG